MPGTIVVTTLSDGTNSTSATNAIQGSAKAWVNFNGTGTVAIRASYNVSSITDNNTGDYTVNFTTAMPNANYAAEVTCAGGAGASFVAPRIDVLSTTSFRFQTINNAGSANLDSAILCVAIFSS